MLWVSLLGFENHPKIITYFIPSTLKKWVYSPVDNHFDLELRSKVVFFTDSCSAEFAFEESE